MRVWQLVLFPVNPSQARVIGLRCYGAAVNLKTLMSPVIHVQERIINSRVNCLSLSEPWGSVLEPFLTSSL